MKTIHLLNGFILILPLAATLAHCAEPTPLPAGAAVPEWPKPTTPVLASDAPEVRSKDLELVYSRAGIGSFMIRVAGQAVAIGQNRPMIGYVIGDQLRWLDLANAAEKKFSVRVRGRTLQAHFECADADGARWKIEQRLGPARVPDALDIETEIVVDQDRAVAFLPMLTVFPGAGTFGDSKGQGLLAGLEYLENEPSSSEADVIGPAAKRQVPDSLKLTFPLMAIEHDGRYVALTWEMRPSFSAVFDSPDRLFGSGGHVMGVLFPGSNGKNRKEGSLLPQASELLQAGKSISLRATLFGGKGNSVVPAVQQYVALRGLPEIPAANLAGAQASGGATRQEDLFQQYVSWASGAWLDSKIRQGSLFRHAIADGGFAPGPAADAALWMDWLATKTRASALAARLQTAAKDALTNIAPADLNAAGIGHVRVPAESLIYGHVAETAARAEQTGHGLLSTFEPDGSVHYHASPGGPDYGKTHFTNEATGFTARPVLDLLEAAAFSGDRELLDAALHRLEAMQKFNDGVPRGAQTWECPLHTPDILASALMVRAYTLGYELSGRTDFLEQARYWAWTGVSFVYLVNPTAQPVGPYATIAVFGATQWEAPVWLGLPVQWCGLVYADALYRLVRDDPQGPWKKIADGITASGVQQSWPAENAAMQGLLPDSFVLRNQDRNGPAINPATLQASSLRYFGQKPAYDFWSFRQNGLRLHAPGETKNARETKGRVSFQVESWVNHPFYVLINGFTAKPRLKLNGKEVECAAPHEFQEKEGRLILKLEGASKVEVGL
jgi:hypothetical protein